MRITAENNGYSLINNLVNSVQEEEVLSCKMCQPISLYKKHNYRVKKMGLLVDLNQFRFQLTIESFQNNR